MVNIKENMIEIFRNRLHFIVCIILISMFIAGCENKAVTNNYEKDINDNLESISENDIGESNTGSIEENTKYSFFGVWKFSRVLPGTISALSQEQDERILGKKVILLKEKCELDDQILENPFYDISTTTVSDFTFGIKVAMEKWDFSEEEKYIDRIRIYDSEEKQNEWSFELEEFKFDIYYTGSRLIIGVGGSYFEMEIDGDGEESTEKNSESGNTQVILGDDVIELLSLKKDSVFERLGAFYDTVEVEYKSSPEGYYFPERGITVVFDDAIDMIDFIKCESVLSVKGVNAGMKFEDIQKILGKSEVNKRWSENTENIIYEIKYQFENYSFLFYSQYENGENSTFIIINEIQE